MNRRTGAELRWPPRLSGLRKAGLHALQQSHAGCEPVLDLPVLSAAEREGKRLRDDYAPISSSIFSVLSQKDIAVFMALFSLAVRQSAPFAAGDGPGSAFASIRQGLCKHFSTYANQKVYVDLRVCEVLAPALLRTDSLLCYSRILTEAAEHLAPAAGLAACGQPASGASAGLRAAAAEAGRGSTQVLLEQDHAGVVQQQRSGAWRPGLEDLDRVLREVLQVLGALFGTLYGEEPAAAAGEIMQDFQAQLQSSYVLEHWARLLLLGTASLLEEGSDQQRTAQTLQMERLHDLLGLLSWSEVCHYAWLERPWGCTLAATHMAQLCAALDGGHAFGLPELEVFILPACISAEAKGLSRYDDDPYVEDTRRARQSASLRLADMLLQSWRRVLSDGMAEEPRAQAMRQAAKSGDGGLDEQQEQGEEQRGGGPGSVALGESRAAAEPGPPGAGLRRLPPFNRPATAALCLRLAKGVLASWGGTLPRVRLQLPDGAVSRDAPRLPKLAGSAVLQHALTCARLALLPDVWHRTRVRGRTRAQLREWWETYVAAAQHPEALLVGEIHEPAYPEWTTEFLEPCGRPSADATAAIEAGLLPCMARLVTRMGAGSGSSGEAVWCPPDRSFPGMAHCWEHLVAYSPLEQMGELLSALGRRLRLAVEELRRAVARAVAGNPAAAGGRGVGWLSEVAEEVMKYSRSRLLDIKWMESDGLTGAGCQVVGAGAEAGTEAGPSGPPARPRSGPSAVRLSYAAAELLPALSQGVRLCAELGPGAGWDAPRPSAGDGSVEALAEFCLSGVSCAGTALAYCNLLLVKYVMVTLEEEAEGGAGGGNGGGGGGGGGAGAPWRQLLLRDVRLMELLGAGVRLLRWQVKVLVKVAGNEKDTGELRDALSRVLPLAAAAFPAEFRAAGVAGGREDAAAAAGSGSGFAEGQERACAGAGGGAGRLQAAPRCIDLAVMREALGGSGAEHGEEQQLGVVTRVLGGWQPAPGELAEVARQHRCLLAYKDDPEDVEALLRAMETPAEARRQVAAAVAAGAARPGG